MLEKKYHVNFSSWSANKSKKNFYLLKIENLVSFSQYFLTQYVEKDIFKRWALCFRIYSRVNCNTYSEAVLID